jgi:polysaccharide biosynthesis/export protein
MKSTKHGGRLTRAILGFLVTFPVLGTLAGCAGGAAPLASDRPARPNDPNSSGQYIIGPGDTLKITVLRNPELNAEVPVRPDGKISTPLVNDVEAVGKTPTELAAAMEKLIGEFVRAPTVNVIVTHPASAYSQVKVVGQAVAPKAVPYRSGMTVLDLVIEVGGLSQYAAGNRAKIVRVEGQSTREIRVRLDDLLNKGKVAENVTLRPGDILVIPETLF